MVVMTSEQKIGLEKQVLQNTKRANLKKIILETIELTGTIAMIALVPQMFMAMKKLGLLPKKRQQEFIKAARDRLVKQGFLRWQNKNLAITKAGRIFLIKETSYIRDRNKNKKWDGKWRVLIFDIPEKRRFVRDQIRQTLVTIGFMQLQKSVWVYPYDCEDLISLLKADFKMGKSVLYMIVDALEYDKPVKSYFGITK
jgi:DNA-binding transcriptional regulator PaaX